AIEDVCRRAACGLEQLGAGVEVVQLDLAFERPAFLALRGLWFVAQMHPRLYPLPRLGPSGGNNVKSGRGATTREVRAGGAVGGPGQRSHPTGRPPLAAR